MLSLTYDWNCSGVKFFLVASRPILSILFARAEISSTFLRPAFGAFLPKDCIASSTNLYGIEPYFQINLNGARKKSTKGFVFLSFTPRLIVPSGFTAFFATSLYFSASFVKPFSSRTLVI